MGLANCLLRTLKFSINSKRQVVIDNHWFIVDHVKNMYLPLSALQEQSIFDLYSFIYCPLMSSKTSHCSRLMVALLARVLDSIMYCPFMLSKISHYSCSIVALCAMVFDSLMYCSLVLRKIGI